MKSILKKVVGITMVAVLALGMFSCSNGSNDESVATPAFSVASGEVARGTSVTITCATKGAKIYYTTDGTTPTTSSTEYTAAISVTSAVTIKAIAVKDGMNDSAVASASYTIKILIPECKLVTGGTVTGAAYTDNYTGVFPAGINVTLDSFYMGKYEVTQAQYKFVMEGQKVTVGNIKYPLPDSPSLCVQGSTMYKVDNDKDHANYPVENVTWFDAVYYCNALSAKEGLDPCYTITVTKADYNGHIEAATVEYDKAKNGYRLPTEAEWEYAARGGDPTAADWNYTFSGANKADGTSYTVSKNAGLDSVGWYGYNNITGTTGDTKVTNSADGKGTHEVGQKAANALGIYDMSGNVSEWCYDDWYGNISADTDDAGASSGDMRVYRGGDWSHNAYTASVSYREGRSPDFRFPTLGFRVCRNAN
ncbi:MAG: SUMF1/EgtB/PvdO family nonheme iron enzyme [Treponema sp.]|nr:SUMF1/EgtB/PvdO family nonheme iron enzyme [Treponema sp.]